MTYDQMGATTAIPFVLGIDLGTTNSVAAVAYPREDGSVQPFRLSVRASGHTEGSLPITVPVEVLRLTQRNLDDTEVADVLFPSVVFQAGPGTPRYVGIGASEAKFRYRRGRSVFYSVKSDLGTNREPFYLAAATPELDTPVKVSAAILTALRVATEAQLGRSLADVYSGPRNLDTKGGSCEEAVR